MKKQSVWTLLGLYFCVLLFIEVGNPFLPLFLKSMVHVGRAELAKLSAMVLSAPLIGLILFAPIWGHLAEKVGRKKMVLRSVFSLCVAQCLIALSYSADMLIATRFLQGVFSGLISAMQIYALHICKPCKKGVMISRLQGVQSLAQALGGIVGGAILLFLSYRYIYFIASAVSFLAGMMIWRYLPDDASFTPKRETPKGQVAGMMVMILVLIFLSQVAKFIPQSIFAFYASNITGHNPLLIGGLYATPALSIILSTELSGRMLDYLRMRNTHQLGACFAYFAFLGMFGALVLAIQSHAVTLMSVFICRLLWGVVLGALLPGLYVMITEFGRARGYLLGLANSITKCGNLSGLYIGAFATGFMPYEQLFLLMALVYMLLSFFSVVTMMWERKEKVKV